MRLGAHHGLTATRLTNADDWSGVLPHPLCEPSPVSLEPWRGDDLDTTVRSSSLIDYRDD